MAPKSSALGTGRWSAEEMLKTNRDKFGVTSDYDESLYTTIIERTPAHGISYAEREIAAARIAKEIEATASDNMHVRIERNQAKDVDYDEEAAFSTVVQEPVAQRMIKLPAFANATTKIDNEPLTFKEALSVKSEKDTLPELSTEHVANTAALPHKSALKNAKSDISDIKQDEEYKRLEASFKQAVIDNKAFYDNLFSNKEYQKMMHDLMTGQNLKL